MESGPQLLNHTFWRIGRWLVTVAILATLTLLSDSRSVQLWSGLLILGCLLLPELGRFLPPLEPYQSWIVPACDIVLVAVLVVAINPALAILFGPLLLGLVSLRQWQWIAAAGVAFFGIQAVQRFPAGGVWTISEMELLMGGIILLGFVAAGWLAHRLAHETAVRQELSLIHI